MANETPSPDDFVVDLYIPHWVKITSFNDWTHFVAVCKPGERTEYFVNGVIQEDPRGQR